MTDAHVLLSARLAQLLEQEPAGEGRSLTLNLLLERTEGRGLFLVIIVFCLPFVAPISIPGMSTPLGFAIALLSLAMIRNRPPRLPKRLGDRTLSPRILKIMRGGGLKFVRWLEQSAKPRKTRWMSWRWARALNAMLIILMAFLLALPLPPLLPPMTNAFPSYAIILLAASMMEEDGQLIWWGYAVALFNFLYFGFWTDFIADHFGVWSHKLAIFLGLAA